jgi:hypothetical protein
MCAGCYPDHFPVLIVLIVFKIVEVSMPEQVIVLRARLKAAMWA